MPLPIARTNRQGGFKGETPSRPSEKIEANPIACIVRDRSQQKSFLFLEEKSCAYKRKAEKTFFAG